MEDKIIFCWLIVIFIFAWSMLFYFSKDPLLSIMYAIGFSMLASLVWLVHLDRLDLPLMKRRKRKW